MSVTLFNTPSIFAGNDIVIINGDSILIDVVIGNNCVWNPSYDLSNPNSCYTYASPTETTTYTVLSTSSNGCIQTDDIVIEVITPEFL